MGSPETIEVKAQSTPPRTTGVTTLSSLPEDLVQEASRRLGIACLVYAAVWALYAVMANFIAPVLSPHQALDPAFPWPGDGVAVFMVVVSVLLFGYTRKSGCDCEFALNLGLMYEVVMAFGIGLLWQPSTMGGISWIAVLILFHPTIVPHTPGKTLTAALVAASMDPLGVLIGSWRGLTVPPLAVLFWSYFPNYVCAVLAILPARIITRLGKQVKRARELGSYQLGDLLGRGGMGEVYMAKHRLLARPAAIKLIRPDAVGARGRDSDLVMRRFRREAEAAASLYSPHTIALYDFGTTGDGTFYYVMELLNGLDFDSLVRRFGPIDPARTIYLLRQACHSLAEAHAIGLIHRDVKPANLYSCRMGLEADFVKVLDFGLVKVARNDSPLQSYATAPGVTTGTPAYMAPELAMGDPSIDRRVDIYALGCVAFWLLTGQLVFDADTAVKMMYEHVRTPPVAPSRRTELSIPPELDDLVLACLDKDRAKRPNDAGDLDRKLAAIPLDEPWTSERAQAWWHKHLPEIQPMQEPARWSAPLETVAVHN